MRISSVFSLAQNKQSDCNSKPKPATAAAVTNQRSDQEQQQQPAGNSQQPTAAVGDGISRASHSHLTRISLVSFGAKIFF
jgi:hypothetical protein